MPLIEAFPVAQEPDDPPPAQISFHAISGHMALETLCVIGFIFDQKVLILVDRGSTHNFIQECLVTTLGLHAQSTPPLHVMIGNGTEIECLQICKHVLLQF